MMLRAGLVAVLLSSISCKVKDPLYCDENTPCTDPERPFCDLEGQYPASEGLGRTCIPDPFAGSDGGEPGDGGVNRTVAHLTTAGAQSCAVLSDGALRCWGLQFDGEIIGDTEFPRSAGDIETGGAVAQTVVSETGICIRYVAGNVRCWGDNSYGLLGYGHKRPVEGPPSELPDVDLGGPAAFLTAGSNFFCALLESGDVRCWGYNSVGQLGLGNTNTVGDTETPAEKNPVNLGGVVLKIASGNAHTCVVLEGGLVTCWGQSGLSGRLGYGNENNIGDTEAPASAGYVNVGGDVVEIAAAQDHTCALLEGGAIRCWGAHGYLGIPGNDSDIGDDEDPASIGTTDVGGSTQQIIAGDAFTCALRVDHKVVCWGGSSRGQLGRGSEEPIGDDETPAQAGSIALGEDVTELSGGFAGRNHSCALLATGAVRCWGANSEGQLGLGHLDDVGDNETPDSQDPVQILD